MGAAMVAEVVLFNELFVIQRWVLAYFHVTLVVFASSRSSKATQSAVGRSHRGATEGAGAGHLKSYEQAAPALCAAGPRARGL